ncbi:MAG: glycosyltransferase family 1 protein [Acidobacteria bacterium]|nr:MAG: glycosyltransferase family 1 protein [Acidobacteriota bacterium]
MKIAYVTAGTAGMYCGSCMNANTLAAAMIAAGHDVALTPTYLTMRIDEEPVARDRIFFGALNVYLQQKLPLFRHTPWLVDRLLDRPLLLRWLGKWSGRADTADVGALTLSMLKGESGRQAKELEKLVRWLARDYRPDVVHLSFAFFLGFARRIKEALDVPIVCSVQGEEIMLDEIPQPFRREIVAEMRRRAADADLFVAPCAAYGDFMRRLLALPPEAMRVAHLGIAADDYAARPLPDAPAQPAGPITIGYLARICPEKGLHQLVEAFRLLAAEHGPDNLRLRIAGYLGPRDRPYVAGLRRQLDDQGLTPRVDWVGEVDRRAKVAFLHSLDLFSVPTVYREPKGIFLLEAQAAGVPVVEPRHGAFPELLAKTGGGLLVEPGDPAALAAGLGSLIDDPRRRLELARRGRAGVLEHFTARAAAERTLALYRSLLDRPSRKRRPAAEAAPTGV